jgi:hypothetical protein
MNDRMTPAELVSDIESHASDKLNYWERKFISDIATALTRNWTLSDKQLAKLKSIHEDYVE